MQNHDQDYEYQVVVVRNQCPDAAAGTGPQPSRSGGGALKWAARETCWCRPDDSNRPLGVVGAEVRQWFNWAPQHSTAKVHKGVSD